jgi:hypothetical protein
LIAESEAAGMAKHVGMGAEGKESGGTVLLQKQIDRRAEQRLALLADEERLAAGLHPGVFLSARHDGAQLVAA